MYPGRYYPRGLARLNRLMDQTFIPSTIFSQMENDLANSFFGDQIFREALKPSQSIAPSDQTTSSTSTPHSIHSTHDKLANHPNSSIATTNTGVAKPNQAVLPYTNDLWNYLLRNDFSPTMDVVENKDNFVVSLNIPGTKKDKVKVAISGDKEKILTISGERKNEVKDEKDGRLLRYESNFGSFSRSFYLPDNVNVEGIKAKHEDGVLNLTIPKIEAAKTEKPAKEIPVE